MVLMIYRIPMVQVFADGLWQQHQKVRIRFSPSKRRGISYFATVRMITYLRIPYMEMAPVPYPPVLNFLASAYTILWDSVSAK